MVLRLGVVAAIVLLVSVSPPLANVAWAVDDGAWLEKAAEEAIAEYRRFAARPQADPARKSRAESEARRLEEAPAPFAEQLFRPAPASEEAKRLFDEGKKDAQAK